MASAQHQLRRGKSNATAGSGAALGGLAADLGAGTLQLDGHSITASQLYQRSEQAAMASIGSKPKARVIVPQAQVEEALAMTTQGKITVQNAWNVKLIEGMPEALGTCMHDEADQYAQFTRAALLCEGGAKVYTHRVDSAYLLSTQMVKRLLRNDTRNDDADDDGAGGNGEEGEKTTRRRRKPLERTLADNPEEINVDGMPSLVAAHLADAAASSSQLGIKGAMAAHGALFRAVTEKFDQGHAQGLLLNNTRLGLSGNLVLDRDYSRDDASSSAAHFTDSVVPVFSLSSGVAINERLVQRAIAESAGPAIAAPDAISGASAAFDFTQSVPASRAVSLAPSAYNLPDGANDSDDDFGGAGGDVGGADDEDVGYYNGDDNAAQPGPSDIHDYVTGDGMIDAIDHAIFDPLKGSSSGTVAALFAEQPGSWVPLSQLSSAPASSSNLSRGRALATIRKACAAKPEVDQEVKQAAKRARKERKAVQFIGVQTGGEVGVDTSAAALELDPNLLVDVRNRLAILTPLGKRLFDEKANAKKDGSGGSTTQAYTNADYARTRAAANHLLLPTEYHDALPLWCGAANASDPLSIEGYFQPFSASTPQWNLLRKTVTISSAAAAAAAQGGAGVVGRTEVMPINVDGWSDGGGDNGGFDDDPDPVEADPPVNNFWSTTAAHAANDEALAELPEVEDGIDLNPPPDMLPAIKVNHATVPSNVDVSKLRSYMWRRTSALSARDVKKSFVAAAAVTTPTAAAAATSVGRVMFSDVITSMLPDVPSISKDGSLSPAFFFFSLLFLANEHNLDLRQVVGSAQLAAALRGEDPMAMAAAEFDAADDDAPMVKGLHASALPPARAGPRRGGENPTRVVERVGCDIVINVPQPKPNAS